MPSRTGCATSRWSGAEGPVSAADAQTRIVAPSVVRAVGLVFCVTGIAGMIITSIADSIDAAIAFGFVGATGALALLLVGVLVPAVERAASLDEEQASRLEERVQRLVAAGAERGRGACRSGCGDRVGKALEGRLRSSPGGGRRHAK